MSKIPSVNYQNQPKLAQQHANYAPMQSFGKGLDSLQGEARRGFLTEFETKIDKKPFLGKRLKWLAGWKGEIQTQVINAVFTTTLAPFWIMHGPFPGDKSEKDKAYLAWRQPISAAIALLVTLPITILINKHMDTWYNEGHVKSIDLRIKPSNSYIKRAFKEKHKQNFISRFGDFIRAKENPKFEKYKSDVGTERSELFSSLMSAEDPKIFTADGSTIKMGQEDLQYDHKIKVTGLSSQKELEEYLKANNFHNLTFRDFMRKHFGFEFYGEKDGKLNGQMKSINDERLSEIKALDFLEEMGLVKEGEVTENELRRVLNVFQQARKIPDIEQLCEDNNVKLERSFIEKLLEFLGKLTTRNHHMAMGEAKGKAKTTSLGHLFHQLGYYTSKDHDEDKTLQGLMDKPMKDVLKELGEHFEGKMKGFNKVDLKEFAKNMITKSAKRMLSYSDNHKFYVNIFFNLFTTMVACSALNWAYPRFVAKFRPDLVKKDNVKGGNK